MKKDQAMLAQIKGRCREVGSCWEWISNAISRDRKLHPQMRTEKGGKPQLVRRVAYEVRHGELPEGRYVVPRCGSAFCVNPEHQWALTEREKNVRTGNIAAVSPSRSTSISKAWRASGRTKLTLERANEIREADGSLKAVASQFGISSSMVGAIKRGELWRDHTNPFTGLLRDSANESGRKAA